MQKVKGHSDSVLVFASQQIRQELLDSQLKVASLQDMSLQLLVNAEGGDCLEAKEKVHVIGNRLKLLLKEVTRDLRELAKVLDITSSQQVRGHTGPAEPEKVCCHCFVCMISNFNECSRFSNLTMFF